jgi:leucyl-tRNA synthetase
MTTEAAPAPEVKAPETKAADDTPAYRYTPALAGEIERRWQRYWTERGTFHAPNPAGPWGQPGVPRDKLYVLDMFPYPSGEGLHVGHPLGFIGTDVYVRFQRMCGANVLHTMGFDAFGLPAEQYAVQTGQHPRKTTEDNIERYLSQIRRLGLGHDERRRVATSDIEFYRWTQWIFLQIFNSWFDERVGKARPIAELEAEYASGERPTPDGRAWSELTVTERRRIINSHRLAYLSDAPVNWCPGLGTVVANEEVTAEGRSDRGNFPVFRRNLRQWMLRITAYADRLIDDLNRLDWPESVKTMQRNWIGRSYGARIRFPVTTTKSAFAPVHIDVFTTRPDTLFGATYMVLAPEHPLVDAITTDTWPPGAVDLRWTNGEASPADAVAAYRRAASQKSELDRQENRDKTGVFTGAYATNPATGEPIPVFVADYVLMGYGTGAIMAVPGQDERDWEFAETFDLPIIRTVEPPEDFDGKAYVGEGPAINSANEEISLNGLGVADAKKAIIDWLAARGHGEAVVQYKLRDWLFSRQRYWGEPFPIVYEVPETEDPGTNDPDTDDAAGLPIGLPEHVLPVELPDIDDFSPKTFDPQDADSMPEAPLSRAVDWVEVELDLGDGPRRYRRETNTMPQWAGSCWYEIRYTDPANHDAMADPEVERYWMGPRPAEHGARDPGGVDLYVGGVEHAVLHLLYARFWQKVLYDLGYVSAEEPFRRLFNQGYIEAYAYTDARGVYVPAEEVAEREGRYFWQGVEVNREYGKMGKSLRNSVTPDEMCQRYGADTFRLYEMSTGPLDTSRPWATRDVVGSYRFLQRVWRLAVDESSGALRVSGVAPSEETLRLLHRTIAGVRADFGGLRHNTAAAKLIELTNHLTKAYPGGAPRSVVEPLALMLAPLCPHLAEELWSRLGHDRSLAHGPFPVADEAYLVAETVEYPIQVNGKVRARVVVPSSTGDDELRAAVLADSKVVEIVNGRKPRKIIVVPGRLVNIVL